MKKIFFALSILLVVSGFVSCKSVEPDADGFTQVKHLTADSVAINEILNPYYASIYINDSYAVVPSKNTNKVLFRYHLPDWTFVDSTFTAGEGPDDLSYPFICPKDNTKGDMWVSTSSLIKKISLTDKALVRTKTISDAVHAGHFTSSVVNENSIINLGHNFSGGQSKIKSYIITPTDSMVVADSITAYDSNYSLSDEEGPFVVLFNNPSIKTYNGRIVVAYPMMNCYFFYTLEKGKFVLEKTIGKPMDIEDVKAKSAALQSSGEMRMFVDKSIVYAGEKLYFLSYDTAKNEKTGKTEVKGLSLCVYDWDIKPIERLVLDHPEAYLVRVDEANDKIYAIDMKKDFEQVYVYDLK